MFPGAWGGESRRSCFSPITQPWHWTRVLNTLYFVTGVWSIRFSELLRALIWLFSVKSSSSIPYQVIVLVSCFLLHYSVRNVTNTPHRYSPFLSMRWRHSQMSYKCNTILSSFEYIQPYFLIIDKRHWFLYGRQMYFLINNLQKNSGAMRMLWKEYICYNLNRGINSYPVCILDNIYSPCSTKLTTYFWFP